MAKSKKVTTVTHKVVKKFMKKSAKHRAKAEAYQQRQELIRKKETTKALIATMGKADPASTVCLAMGCDKPGKQMTHNGLFCKPHAKRMRDIRLRLRDAKLSGDVAAEARWRRKEVAFRKDADLGHIHAWTMREVEAAQIAAGLERAGLGYPSEQQVAAAAAAPPSREELAALHSSARQVEAVFLAAAVKPAAGSPVRRQYGPSAPADAVAGPTLPATLPQPAQLALPAGPLSALLPSPFVPQPMPSRALELARLHQAWQQKHFKRMPLSQYLNGRWAGPVWVPQRDVPASGRDAVLPAAPVQTGPAAAAAPASEHVQQPARRTSAAAVSSAAAEEEPDADGEPAPRSAHGDRHERQRVAKQARLLAKLEKGQKAEAQRLKRRQKLLRRAAKRAAAAQRQRLSAEQRADDGTAASADDDATDADDASKLPRAVLLGQPLEPLRCPLAQQPVAGSAAAELAQHEQPVSLPTYDPWQDVDSPHPAPLLPCTSASVEPAAAEQGAPLAAVAAPAAAVTDAAEQESSLESGEVGACCAWNEAPLACGSDLALRLTPEPGQNAQPRTGDQAPLLLKPKKGNLNKAQRYKRRLERLARLAAQREAAQQKRQAAQQRADHGAAASADDGAMHTDDLLDTPGTPLPGQPSESSRAPLLGQQPAAGSAAAEPAQAEQPVSPPIYDPWQDVDHPHPAPPLAHTSASAEPEAAAQEAPAAYDPWEAAESSQGLQLPTTTEQWSPIVHRDAEHVDPPAQGVGLPAAPPHTGAAATGLRSASTAAPHLVPAGERSQQQPERPSAAEAGYDPWEEQGGDAAQLTAKASSANEQPVQPAEKQPSAAVADYDPWVDVEA